MKCRYFCRLPLDISPVYLTRGISTLYAAAVQNAGKRERFSVLRAAFPSAKALHCAPHSLPAAWGRRLIRYGKESIQNRTSLRKSVEIGKRRVVLLKTYHLIK